MSNLECLFCRIARGEVPARVVHESENVVAFLDVRALTFRPAPLATAAELDASAEMIKRRLVFAWP
jgi:hypothetical protein